MIIDEKLVIDVLTKHSREIMQWINDEEIHSVNNATNDAINNVKPEGDPVERLPLGLQKKTQKTSEGSETLLPATASHSRPTDG